MRALARWPSLAALCAFIALAAASCSRAEPQAPKGPVPASPAPQAAPAEPREDARSAFESRSWLELPGRSPEAGGARIAIPGRVLAGPARVGLGGGPGEDLAAAAIEGAGGAFLVVVGARGEERASLSLPSAPLALASAEGAIAVACEDGSLQCFALGGGDGAALERRWVEADVAAGPLLMVPDRQEQAPPAGSGGAGASGRVFAALRDGTVECLSLAEGRRAWASDAGAAIADLAYARGFVVVCAGGRVVAYAEADGTMAWAAETGGRPLVAASGQGLVAFVDSGGSLTILGAADGKPLSVAEGSFDPAIRPAIDGGIVYAALPGGGAAAIGAKTGKAIKSWSWPAPTAFLCVASSSIYASSGTRLLVRGRFDEGQGKDLELPSAPTGGAGELVAFEGGLIMACRGGLVAPSRADGRLDAALAPPAETAAAIEEALAGLGGEWLAGKKPTYGWFVSGIPVYPPDGFSVARYEAKEGSRRSFAASPDPGDAILALFDERGVKIAANADELGSPGRLTAWLEGGRTYWIAAAGRGARLEGGFSLVMK
jgi:outer membrane protein assembly factor BamB